MMIQNFRKNKMKVFSKESLTPVAKLRNCKRAKQFAQSISTTTEWTPSKGRPSATKDKNPTYRRTTICYYLPCPMI